MSSFLTKPFNHTTAKWTILILAFVLFTRGLIAQSPQVKTSVDRTEILIGEQIQYHVETSVPDGFRLSWFNTPDSFGTFEVITKGNIDTVVTDGNVLFSQLLTLTSFDSGRRSIPSLRLVAERVEGGSLYNLFTDSIAVSVSFSPLDSVKTFHDIKSIIEVEKKWPWWIWLVMVLAAVLLVAIIILAGRYFNKKKEPELIQAKLSPYEEALLSLKNLKERDLPRMHEVKAYHSELSEIFKRFMTRKTNMNKLHLTSDEILLELNEYAIERSQLTGFANCLRMSSAVKFAKFVPRPDESEECFEQTKDMIKHINQYLNSKTPSAT